MKEVSIIVPVYNTEKYLNRCLDSLVSQTLDDIEIICVNDGSTDNSLSILEEYREKYADKIVIINKKNEGLWNARYDGIKIATGEYSTFVDSDDYVSKEFAEKLYVSAKTNNSDISVCGFYRIDSNTNHICSKEMIMPSSYIINFNTNPEGLLSVNPSLCNKLFRTSLLKGIPTLTNPPDMLEDMMRLLLISMYATKISFTPDYLYYYMTRSNSIISTVKKEQIEEIKSAMLEVKNIYLGNNASSKLLYVMDAIAFIHFGLSLMFRISYDKEANLKAEIKSINEFLDFNFPSWRKSKYLKLSYSLTHKFSNFKIAVMKKIYIMHLYPAFLVLYRFMIDKLKIDIKW